MIRETYLYADEAWIRQRKVGSSIVLSNCSLDAIKIKGNRIGALFAEAGNGTHFISRASYLDAEPHEEFLQLVTTSSWEDVRREESNRVRSDISPKEFKAEPDEWTRLVHDTRFEINIENYFAD